MSNLLKFSRINYTNNSNLLSINLIRDIAQLGRAPALGAGCRRFKSYYPEINLNSTYSEFSLILVNFFGLMEFNFFSIIFIWKLELLTDSHFPILCNYLLLN